MFPAISSTCSRRWPERGLGSPLWGGGDRGSTGARPLQCGSWGCGEGQAAAGLGRTESRTIQSVPVQVPSPLRSCQKDEALGFGASTALLVPTPTFQTATPAGGSTHFIFRPKWGFPGGSDGEEPACNAGDLGFDPWVGKTPWRREQLPAPIFWPGEFHGQRSLAGYCPKGRKESDTTE